MTYRMIRHPEVEQDLEAILVLILDYAGPQIALRKLAEIEASIESLTDGPHRGTLRDEIHQDLRVIPTARKGAICFTVDDDAKEVLIIAVAYAGQEWARMIEDRS